MICFKQIRTVQWLQQSEKIHAYNKRRVKGLLSLCAPKKIINIHTVHYSYSHPLSKVEVLGIFTRSNNNKPAASNSTHWSKANPGQLPFAGIWLFLLNSIIDMKDVKSLLCNLAFPSKDTRPRWERFVTAHFSRWLWMWNVLNIFMGPKEKEIHLALAQDGKRFLSNSDSNKHFFFKMIRTIESSWLFEKTQTPYYRNIKRYAFIKKTASVYSFSLLIICQKSCILPQLENQPFPLPSKPHNTGHPCKRYRVLKSSFLLFHYSCIILCFSEPVSWPWGEANLFTHRVYF